MKDNGYANLFIDTIYVDDEADPIGIPNPFLEISCGSGHWKTSKHYGHFVSIQQYFNCGIMNKEAYINIQIYDADFLRDDNLGSVKVSISEISERNQLGKLVSFSYAYGYVQMRLTYS